MAPAAETTTSGWAGICSFQFAGHLYQAEVAGAGSGFSAWLPITGVRAGSRPNGRAACDPFTPTGPFPPAVPAESLMVALGLLGDPVEFTTAGLVTTRLDLRSSPPPSSWKPTGLIPPSGPAGPNCCPGTGCSRPALGSGSASTSSPIAQLVSPDVSAATLALAVV